MRTLKFTLAAASLSVLAFGNAPPVLAADTICAGTITGTHANVIVDGTTCTLDGAVVTGNVLISNGGTLAAKNGTSIAGAMQATGGGNISIDASTLSSGVSLNQSADLAITNSTVTGSVSLTGSGNVAVEAGASVGSLITSDSLGITLDDASIPGGVSMSLANGSLTSCSATIGGGGIFVTQTTGDVSLDATKRSCLPTVIDDGSLNVNKGTGNVLVVGADLFDLIVLEQIGNVTVSDTKFLRGLALSDLSVKFLTGSMTLGRVTTDSDVTVSNVTGIVAIDALSMTGDAFISNNLGDVTLNRSNLIGDAVITLNGGAVNVTKNSLNLEDATLSTNAGPILVDRNCDLNLVISGNNNVTISNNNERDAERAGAVCNGDGFGFTDVSVTKNLSGVSIVNNTGELLTCADNVPAPVGSGNTFTITDGQCLGF